MSLEMPTDSRPVRGTTGLEREVSRRGRLWVADWSAYDLRIPGHARQQQYIAYGRINER